MQCMMAATFRVGADYPAEQCLTPGQFALSTSILNFLYLSILQAVLSSSSVDKKTKLVPTIYDRLAIEDLADVFFASCKH
ncbi:hypothetical protein RB195_016540 [Necator americanus]|uniref:Uncharacterized protein n=1 Tax=Necator americanus TaxID=51031 RepID=A0ABR1C3L5_NECAM